MQQQPKKTKSRKPRKVTSVGSNVFINISNVETCELGVHQKDLGCIVVHYKVCTMLIVHF